MPVFRVEKNANYTTMSNHHLRDRTLSMKAKGLLSMLLSLPETWNYSVRGITAISKENVDVVTNAMKELEQHGYLHREQMRTARGRLGKTRYVIYEVPHAEAYSSSPCVEKPDTVSPYTNPSCTIIISFILPLFAVDCSTDCCVAILNSSAASGSPQNLPFWRTPVPVSGSRQAPRGGTPRRGSRMPASPVPATS